MSARVVTEPRMLIGGQWSAAASGEVFETIDPSTGSLLARVPRADEKDVDRAVAAAVAAAPAWGRMDARARGRLLLEVAHRMREKSERLATLDALDAGIPLRVARADVGRGIERLEYFAELAQEVKGETYPTARGSFIYTLRQPYGVVAVVNPFNHPVMFALSKPAAPLAAGNTVVVKPPEQAPLSTVEMAEIFAEVLPPGVFNVVTGLGPSTGAALVRHPAVRKISFTGSVRTGQAILAATAANVVPAVLELGGKNANIVFPDADLERAVQGAVGGMSLGVCGQSCQSGTRLFLHRQIHDEFVQRLVARLNEVRVGVALDESTEMGPMISARQLETVLSYVEDGRRAGARLLAGGSALEDVPLQGGFFIRPTVFDGVDMSMRIAREEIFGPILSILVWDDRDDMIKAVNSLEYGLTASVWSQNVEAHEIVREIEAGYVYINQHGGSALGVPFGGWKQSGMGVEHSRDELLDYTRIKTVDARVP